ncbi:MAG: LysR family transcriptional regulator [Bdellovibrionales bacterium]|nr:LysR family transcriptional regulator [Bdellovibrionales bacterium]
MIFDLDDLGTLVLFSKVVENGSFSETARQMGIAKSAVSKRITDLEKKMGVKLLVRTTRKVSLSESGLELLDYSRQISDAAKTASSIFQKTNLKDSGTIRVNSSGLFADHILLPAVIEYQEMNPEVQFDIKSDDTLIDLATEKFDLIVRYTRVIKNQSAVGRKLGEDRLCISASPEYLEKRGVPKKIEDLTHHNCMRYSPRTAKSEWCFQVRKKPFSPELSFSFLSCNDSLLKNAAKEHFGLCIMPTSFVRDSYEDGSLVEVLKGQLWAPERLIYGIMPEGHLAPARVKKFLQFLSKKVPSPY